MHRTDHHHPACHVDHNIGPCLLQHVDDRPDDIFYDVNTAADIVDHAALLNHHNGIRTDDQHDAEHRLDRAIAQYLNDRRNPQLTDNEWRSLVGAISTSASAALWHLTRDR